MGLVSVGWHRDYAEWLAVQPVIPSKLEKQAQALALSGRRQTFVELRDIETSTVFLGLMREIAREQIDEARRLFQSRSNKMATDFFAMADLAIQNEDYDKWAKYGIPYLNRVWPETKDGGTQVNTQVVVNFSGFAAKQQIAEAEYEVVVNPE